MITELMQATTLGVLMPQEVADLAEHALEVVASDPEIKSFVDEFVASREGWTEAAVINFLLLQAITVNL